MSSLRLNVQILNIDLDLGKLGIASVAGEWEYASHIVTLVTEDMVSEDATRHLCQSQTKNKCNRCHS